MLAFKNQVIGNYGMVHVYFHELWFIVSGIHKYCRLFPTKHFQAKVNDNIFCSGSGFRDKTMYIKGWKMSKSVSSSILFIFSKVQ